MSRRSGIGLLLLPLRLLLLALLLSPRLLLLLLLLALDLVWWPSMLSQRSSWRQVKRLRDKGGGDAGDNKGGGSVNGMDAGRDSHAVATPTEQLSRGLSGCSGSE